MDDAFAYCEQRVRNEDRDRFLSTLFAPAAQRPLLYALYAFDLEIAGLPARLSEPLAGELRLQWWREALDGTRAEEARGHPVAHAVLQAMTRCSLPAAPLLGLLDARSSDLYGEPMASTAQFDAHALDTNGAILRVALRILGSSGGDAVETAVAPASLALAYTDALRRFPHEAARGRLSIPSEVLQRHGADTADALAEHPAALLAAALADMRTRARGHFESASAAIGRLPVGLRPAFLHVILVPRTLDQMERHSSHPFRETQDAAWRRQWALWRASRRWLR